jgi:hypothetical protein
LGTKNGDCKKRKEKYFGFFLKKNLGEKKKKNLGEKKNFG